MNMADNYLITGYWGEPHVTAENDRGIQGGIVGAGRYVLPVGNQFRAEYIGNNTIRMYDGKLMDNGAAAGVAAGEYVDFLIANASQGMQRNDLIVFQYSRDTSTMIETGTFVVLQGTEVSGTAADPALEQEDLLAGDAVMDQMALYRIPVSGVTISEPVRLFGVSQSLIDHVHGNITNDGKMGTASGRIITTGTGGKMEASTPAAARTMLELADVAKTGSYNDLKDLPEEFKVDVSDTVTADGTDPVSGKAVADYVAAQIGAIVNYEGVAF
jgi:hypothetical protein